MIRRSFGFAVAPAAAVVATAAVSRYLQSTELVSPETGQRIVQVMQVVSGLGFAVWGNYIPKGFGTPPAQACAAGHARSAVRVGGWAMTLAGLTYAAVWAFAPASVARPIAGAAVATAAVVAMIYCARIAGPRVLRRSVETEP
jgi:hypothetical protein